MYVKCVNYVGCSLYLANGLAFWSAHPRRMGSDRDSLPAKDSAIPTSARGQSGWAWSLPIDGKPGNLLRQLALPRRVRTWSPTTLQEKPTKIWAEVVNHAKAVSFHEAEVDVPRAFVATIPGRMGRLGAAYSGARRAVWGGTTVAIRSDPSTPERKDDHHRRRPASGLFLVPARNRRWAREGDPGRP